MGGSMGVTQGMLDEFGPERVRNTPISEMAIVGSRHRRGDAGHAPRRRDHVRGLPDALAGAARQPGGEAPLHVRRPAEGAADRAHAGRRGLVAGRAARAAARGVVRPRPGAEGRVRLDADATCAGCSGRRSTTTTRSSSSSTARSTGSRRRCPTSSSRSRSARRASTAQGEDVTVVADRPARPRGARGRRGGGEGGRLGRGRRPAHAAAARRAGARRRRSRRRTAASSRTRRSRGWASAPRSRRSSSTTPSTGSTPRSSASARRSRRCRSRP